MTVQSPTSTPILDGSPSLNQRIRRVGGVWVDRFGVVAASICAAHCAVMSIAPALLSILGLSVLHDERFEWGFVVCAVAFAGTAALLGQRTHHMWPISVGFGVGALALVGARTLEVAGIEGGVWLALLGGAVLVGTHVINTFRCRSCSTGECR
ncbi:MAG: MerC family mercury resistance protein [Rhodobacterales bacterium]|nr:MerC family mercury resistance protein [Rhodobacterales bacterium]